MLVSQMYGCNNYGKFMHNKCQSDRHELIKWNNAILKQFELSYSFYNQNEKFYDKQTEYNT